MRLPPSRSRKHENVVVRLICGRSGHYPMRKPLFVDLFCGLGGWAEGGLAAGYDVVGFDNGHTAPYAHGAKYPGQLVIQDVLTLHGSQFRDAALIVASPPCQNYSYLAMPWSRSKDPNNSKAAKALRKKWETDGPDNRLFDACFRIQREAIEAAGRYIPLVVENVRGAQPWVGRAKANFGSFSLWGDVAQVGRRIVAGVPEFGAGMRSGGTLKGYGGGWFGDNGFAGNKARTMELERPGGPRTAGVKVDGPSGDDWFAKHNRDSFMDLHEGRKANPDGTDHPQGSWFRIADSSQGDRGQKVPAYSDPRRNGGKGVHLTSPAENADGTKIGGDWFRDPACHSKHGSRSNARKQASALIAKIPFDLAFYIASAFRPLP